MRTRTHWIVSGATVVVLVGGGATAYAATAKDGSASSYRLSSVTRGTVEETLTSAGTVDKKNRADVAFQTSGTVAKVSVTLGQHVTTGQVIATLDPTDARADVDSARATLAKARAQLVSDESAQSSALSSTPSTGSTGTSGASQPQATKKSAAPQATNGSGTGSRSGSGSGSSSGPSSSGTAVAAALARLTAQQRGVTSAQSGVTRALSDAADALTAQGQACGTTGTAVSGSTTGDTAASPSQACQDALAAVQTKQQATKTAEQALSDALTALTTTLTNAVKAVQQASLSSSTSATSPTISLTAYHSSTVSADDASGGASDPQQGQTVTAATLAKDQASIDTADAGLIEARRSLAATVLRAPITGSVASLDLAAGDSATTGDTATVITNGSALLVTSSVSESKIRDITVGQQVVVSTPGSSTTSAGTIAAIGVTADSDSSTVSYPVTVEVPQPSSMLGSGSSVVLRIITASARHVLTVPSSAVTTAGTRSTVRVLTTDDTVTTTPITLGAVGATRTQVKTGLNAGQRVVLADLDQTITGASTSVNTSGGAGRPGGGAPGGGAGSGVGGGTGGPPGAP